MQENFKFVSSFYLNNPSTRDQLHITKFHGCHQFLPRYQHQLDTFGCPQRLPCLFSLIACCLIIRRAAYRFPIPHGIPELQRSTPKIEPSHVCQILSCSSLDQGSKMSKSLQYTALPTLTNIGTKHRNCE